MSEFKPGDRVKVEYEAIFKNDSAFAGLALVTIVDFPLHPIAPLSALSKLPDPEPQWRKGDVVRFQEWSQGAFHVALRQGGPWECSCGIAFRDDYMADRWRAGVVEVLHREDPS